MRLIILADVHGNWDALLALQRAEPRPDGVLFLGDAVGFGPEPAPCVDWLGAQASHLVRGDFDDWVTGGPRLEAPAGLEAGAEATAALARRTLSERALETLRGWPTTQRLAYPAGSLFLAHATPADPLFGSADLLTTPYARLRQAADVAQADFVCLGHSHVPALRRVGDVLFVNPGSLGQPRYGVPDPTYAVWTDGDVQIRHLHYHPEPVCQKLALLPLEPEIVAALSEVLRTGLIP
jgi:protein phosphatase